MQTLKNSHLVFQNEDNTIIYSFYFLLKLLLYFHIILQYFLCSISSISNYNFHNIYKFNINIYSIPNPTLPYNHLIPPALSQPSDVP